MTERFIRVLLIDDNEDDFVQTRRLLQSARFDRFQLEWTPRFDEGLNALKGQKFDAYLIDYRIGERAGLDLVRAAVAAGCVAPMILLTGANADGLTLDALLAGSSDYLDKTRLDEYALEHSLRGAIDRALHFEELQKSEERFRALVENLSDGIKRLGQDGTILYASRSTTAILGYQVEQLIGHSLFDFIHPEDRPGAMRLFSECLNRPGAAILSQYRHKSADGGWKHLEVVTVNRLGESAVRAVVATIRDISERKENERDLLERERQFRALFDAALDAMVLIGDDRRFLDANPAAAQLFRLPREQLIQQVIDRFCPPEFPVVERWTEFIEAGEFKGNFTLRLDEHTRREVELSARAHVLPGRHLLVARDVTDRNEMEARLRQGAKMEAVGRLAGGIAHDFNNLLTAILGSAELLALDLEDVGSAREDLEEIRKAATRAASLTHQLLAFSRRQVLNPKTLDLNTVIEGTRRMLARLIGEDIELITRSHPRLGRVRADPTQLEQILLNLAINSRDAMPEGGTLIISTENADAPAEWKDPPPACVALVMTDTGNGMSEHTRGHLFEPFFTTKDIGKGTGLGLATVYGIVKQSGGYITVESAPGNGTAIRIYLPRVDAPLDSTTTGPGLGTAARGSETILLVEDEVSVRRLARRVLLSKGYVVLEAANGQEALRLVSEHTGPLDLVLTDVVMPGMSGPEMAERLSREQPGLRVLYMSGYADEAIGRHGVLETGVQFLQKPFTPQDLAQRVREVLGPNNASGH
ncbi:MAG TPA: response regulator [Gemmatimonadales bacterium]|jgi:PAS domain S-box-containing protein|nr:response regulator [Gemmatimonadales bacterium]